VTEFEFLGGVAYPEF